MKIPIWTRILLWFKGYKFGYDVGSPNDYGVFIWYKTLFGKMYVMKENIIIKPPPNEEKEK